MNEQHTMIEAEARALVSDRLVRARAPRMPATTLPRHRLARGLRRVADRLDP
ncbi:hypothetical protein ABKW28_18000 [Nocardioides sp. 31GB23]|uniref:Uncharacterized protein n=1 Tax=Nocardioides salarius TaxID=374513 RepID=A0ABS2MBP3_9ACTN|nr:hypothetical protein [Nocardioides salarius]MBM7508580.1 hypothetical protein [Nocardioides salarius]